MVTLSEKMREIGKSDIGTLGITPGDVYEFIKDLKEEINKFAIHKVGVHRGFLCHQIDKLAGDKLI